MVVVVVVVVLLMMRIIECKMVLLIVIMEMTLLTISNRKIQCLCFPSLTRICIYKQSSSPST